MYPLLLFATLVLISALFVGLDARRRAKVFKKQFPPISNEEFLARCTPGTNPYIALKVRRVLSESLGVEYERIYPESRLVEDLGAD